MLEEVGYSITQHVLSHDECATLAAQLGDLEDLRSRAGARHLIGIPAVHDLANDARLLAIALSVLGSRAVAYRATLFDKSADSNWSVAWHQDTALPLRRRFEAAGWGPWSVKAGITYAHAPTSALERVVALRIHLDDSTATNGPLRVIPGSHRLGVLSEDQVGEIAHSSARVECLVDRGGVLAMRPLLLHASSRVTVPAPRRVLHIEYAEDLEILPGIHLTEA